MIRPRTLPALAFLLGLLAGPALRAQETDPAGPADPVLQAGSQDDSAKRARRDAILAEMREDEIEHRRRLAITARLTQLALEQEDWRRAALLDKLEVKEYARYHRKFQARRSQIDDRTYRIAEMALAKGRVRAAEAERAREKASRKASPEELRELRERAGIAPDDPRLPENQPPKPPEADEGAPRGRR